jgi:hypothetical protein
MPFKHTKISATGNLKVYQDLVNKPKERFRDAFKDLDVNRGKGERHPRRSDGGGDGRKWWGPRW